MPVEFLKEVVTSFGTFVVGQIHHMEDEHTISHWVEQGIVKIMALPSEPPVAPVAPADPAPVAPVEPKAVDGQ